MFVNSSVFDQWKNVDLCSAWYVVFTVYTSECRLEMFRVDYYTTLC